MLTRLILCRGEVVSREELRQTVWGEETFVDFERGLNFCIAQIRSALGDDSTSPRYVRTIPKRGYQFIAPVEEILTERPATVSAPPVSVPFRFPTGAIIIACAAILLTVGVWSAGYWLRLTRQSKNRPIVAVAKFDNETGDAGLTRLSDGLTDHVVEQLTVQSLERYKVIGNAAILRLPREQRDLGAISTSLHASYAVLGQVQGDGVHTRILAHLIRLPDQTHLWVARIDGSSGDALKFEQDVSARIASEFSQRVAKDASGSPLPPFPNH